METARLELIAETVLGLAGALEDAGVGLVFGGHPSITQMLAPLVLEPGRRKDPWLILFQHERFWDSFVEDVGVMAWMEGVTCVLTRRTGGGEDLKTEMARMRESMLEVPGIEAAVFVGGLDGIEEEYDLVKEKLPGIRRFAVGVGGGAAAELLLGKGLEAAGHLKGEAKRSRPPLPEDTAPLWHSPDRAVDTILAALGITPEP